MMNYSKAKKIPLQKGSFGAIIKQARLNAELTQEQLGQLLGGKSATHIFQIEKNKPLPANIFEVEKIAEILDLPKTELINLFLFEKAVALIEKGLQYKNRAKKSPFDPESELHQENSSPEEIQQALKNYFQEHLIENFPSLPAAELSAEKKVVSAMENMHKSDQDQPPFMPAVLPLKIIVAKEYGKEFLASETLNNYVPIRLLSDEVAAGNAREINAQDIEGYCLIYHSWCYGKDPENYICLRVKGDSMSPILEDNYIVAIDLTQKDPHLLLNRMVAIKREGSLITIRRLKKGGSTTGSSSHWMGVPDNPEAEAILLEDPAKSLIGKVVWFWGRLA